MKITLTSEHYLETKAVLTKTHSETHINIKCVQYSGLFVRTVGSL
jgi:hypothetical protein